MTFLSSCFGSKTNLNDKNDNFSTLGSPLQLKKKSIQHNPSDEEIIRFENDLKMEEAAQGPLVSPAMPLAVLHDEFPDTNFAHKFKLLQSLHNFEQVRKCRRDGNCFYRAVAFNLIEAFKNKPELNIAKFQEKWNSKLKNVGYEPVIFEDFSESFWSFVTGNLSTQEAWECDEYTSNMALMLLRLLTSAEIRSNPDDYAAFIELGAVDENLEKWCERCVDAVGVDADQVQLIALAKTIQIEIVVANLGSGMDSEDLQVTEFDFKQNKDDLVVCLLYRPGHYDILYKKERN